MISNEKIPYSSYAMLLATAALWGGTWVVGKLIAHRIDPWNASFIRFSIASGALILLTWKLEGLKSLRIRRSQLLPLFLLSLTGIFGYCYLFFLGLQTTSASRASIIIACCPVTIAFSSSLLSKDRIPWASITGMLLALLGVTIVISNGNPLLLIKGDFVLGDICVVGCVICWTTYTLLGKPLINNMAPIAVVTWACSIGSIMILPFAIHSGLSAKVFDLRMQDWVALFYLSIFATSLAYYWYYTGLHRVGPIQTSIFINMVPLFTLGSAIVFLDEEFTTPMLYGIILVISGVILTIRTNIKVNKPKLITSL